MNAVRSIALGAVVVVALGWLAIASWRDRAAQRAALPIEQGSLQVAGIREPVAIYRDARGVPHVLANNETDAFFGWGFAHAQDRLAQMVSLVLAARGRSAELEGPEALAGDRWARTIGFGELADAQYERLDGLARARLLAYAAGVNARIERIRSGAVAAPVALRGFALEADHWKPQDSLAIAKLYAWGLSNSVSVSLVLRDVNARLGSRAAAVFFPRGSAAAAGAGAAVTAQRTPGGARAVPPPPSASPAPATSWEGLRRLQRAIGLDGRSVGSSAWVLGSASTESGHPVLAADAHLEPTAPSLLHVAQVHGGAFDATGAAIPGVPLFWTGHNRTLAWASTHAQAATLDLYEEKIGDADPGQYHDGKTWRPVGHRVETLRARGGLEEQLDVRSTRHGPLVHTLLDGESDPLALSWVGARTDVRSAFESMTQVALAEGERQLLAALAEHHEPPLVIAYADGEGRGGTQVAGWFPVRALPTDLVPLPGRARWYDWSGRIPFEDLPRRRLSGGSADGTGWVIAADNALPAGEPGQQIDWLWRSGARKRRIEALLRAESKVGAVDLRRMAAIQGDVVSQRSPTLVSTALALAGDPAQWSVQARDVAGALRAWDGRSTADSIGASVYHVFAENLAGTLLRAALGDELAVRYRALRQVDLHGVLIGLLKLASDGTEEGDGPLGDAVAPEAIARAVREALRDSWLQLSYRLGANRDKWQWGHLHQLGFRRFGAERSGGALEGMLEIPYVGSFDSINTGEFAGGDSFAVRVASTFRIVVDAGSPDQSLMSIAPGQSEHPQDPHYRDGLDDWLAGNPRLLITNLVVVRESGTRRLSLEPRP